MLVVVLGVFRGGVRLCSVSRLVGVVGRVQSVLIDVVRLVFCSCSVRRPMHLFRVRVFVGSIVLLALVDFLGIGCGWRLLVLIWVYYRSFAAF